MTPVGSMIATIVATALAGAAIASAQEPAPVVNAAPTARDWAAIGQLPDFSGVWTAGPIDRFAPGAATAPPRHRDTATPRHRDTVEARAGPGKRVPRDIE
jgi:hypothetical protein